LGPQTTWFALTLDVGHAVRCPQAVPTVRGSRSGPWEIVCSPFRFFLRTAHGPSVFLTRSLSYCATQHTSVPDRGLLPAPVRRVAVVWAVNRCCSKGSVCHSRSRFFPHIREPVQLVARGRPQEGPQVPRGWGPMSEHRVVQFAFG